MKLHSFSTSTYRQQDSKFLVCHVENCGKWNQSKVRAKSSRRRLLVTIFVVTCIWADLCLLVQLDFSQFSPLYPLLILHISSGSPFTLDRPAQRRWQYRTDAPLFTQSNCPSQLCGKRLSHHDSHVLQLLTLHTPSFARAGARRRKIGTISAPGSPAQGRLSVVAPTAVYLVGNFEGVIRDSIRVFSSCDASAFRRTISLRFDRNGPRAAPLPAKIYICRLFRGLRKGTGSEGQYTPEQS